MESQELRQALHDGRRVFGTCVVSESPLWPRGLATVGLDFVFIDTEHIALTNSQVAAMCQAYRGVRLAPIVRIPSPDPTTAAKMIDIGAGGVIAPYVETPEQARGIVGAVRWRPLKGKRLAARLAGESIEPELESYLVQRNNPNVLVLNIESVPAMESLDDIVSVEGVDSVLIGPHDLSCSLGLPEQYDHPDFLAACKTIFTTARSHGIGAGIHFMGEVDEQVRFLELGANMLIHSTDIRIVTKCLQQDLAAIREAVGEEERHGEGEVDAI